MRAPFELETLARLRSSGQAPVLPVWITNNRMLGENLKRAGVLVIYVVSDHFACDWSPLAGLEVFLALSFADTPVGARLAIAIRNSHPRGLRLWFPVEPFRSTMLLARPAPVNQ